ncbi:MAG: thioredoxin domain-containing protein [Vicinamibacterales bacterium]
MPRPPQTARRLAALVLTLLLGVSQGCARPAADVEALKAEVASLREAQARTASELAELRAQLARAPGPAAAPGAAPAAGAPVRSLTVANRPARGAATARVTLIEYSDYGCPFCAQYATQVYPRLIREYVDSGQVRYVFKNYPIEALHPGVFKAHVAAACAGDQGRYWEMHDRLFGDQGSFTAAGLAEHARLAGLDTAAFGTCVAGTSHDRVIREDIDEAVRGGVTGTPVFVVGLTDPRGGAVTPLRVVVGAQPYQAFKDAIDAVLAEAGAAGGNE